MSFKVFRVVCVELVVNIIEKAYEHEHKESIMAQADHAVEAMPKKKEAIVDEIDAIELPEYMQARKTVHTEETPEIPDLPEV